MSLTKRVGLGVTLGVDTTGGTTFVLLANVVGVSLAMLRQQWRKRPY
jgi:hypothetical protein